MYGGLPYSLRMGANVKRVVRRELKTQRLELRVSVSARTVIERATAVSGLAAGDLAYQGAQQVLEAHERLELRGADREVFLKAVARPPAPTARLIAAFRAHRKPVR